MRKLIPFLIALAATLPAAAHADWSHQPSGVSVPDRIGDMTRGDERDLSNGEKADVMVQYGTDSEPATLYVYRSSLPNPALWFDRTRAAMISRLPGIDRNKSPRAFTSGGSPTPNGLREEFGLDGKPWTATGVAFVQAGEWLVKLRLTSQTLDEAGMSKKIDGFLAALRFTAPITASLPLTAPAPCTKAVSYDGKPKNDEKLIVAGGVTGLTVYSDARGGGFGLSALPADWCRDDIGDPSLREFATLYRRLDGSGWTALLGDSGISVTALALEPASGKGRSSGNSALYYTGTGPTELISGYDGIPSLIQAFSAVTPVLRGLGQSRARISTSPPTK